ncbi:MAG: DUF2905 domain-containing protein [bacterium]
MTNFDGIGKFLIYAGLFLLFLGVLLTFARHIPFLGKLPGDILIQKKNFTLYFPITTSILISIVLSILLFLLSKK